MKKFLSLVLAMIMALSLVTISAGAVDYDELTDKDEITYEEAVAVLNKIGIIEGYPDGSYRPDAPLTRQVAAKFIVSLLIGPEAAENLTAAVAPYPDVPVTSQFAGYISYCKTANIIDGYSDGTFRPEASLTGYAFSKMLLGAIGYRGDVEGFSGTGWTMNVARIGNAANLFDRLRFQGGEPLNRETAAQLCLNTLKATMVEYSGGFNITSGDATIVGAQTRSYVTSNQDYAGNISNRKVSDQTVGGGTNRSAPYTVEFGEEHFKDLRLNYDGTAIDSFGRPSNEWSWKKVTFGTFPLDPDFIYTEQVAHNVSDVTNATKVRALGLNGYKLEADDTTLDNTRMFVNGDEEHYGEDFLDDVSEIADYTDNGTIVEVYISNDEADLISHVVVIQTQLMEIKRVGSDFVTLDTISHDANAANSGYNQPAIHVPVEEVEEDNVNYSFLSGLKTGDLVAVIPVAIDGDGDNGYEVDTAYAPEEVTGELTRVDTYGKSTSERQAVTVTVGGTKYPIAQWHKDLGGIDADKIKVTRDDVKLYLDCFGNALRAKNVGETSDFMVIRGYSSGLVNSKIVHYVDGWDIKGNELTLNIGSSDTTYTGYQNDYKPGDLVHYTNQTNSSSAEWILNMVGVGDINTSSHTTGLSASNVRINLTNFNGTNANTGASPYHTADKMKMIYVSFDEDGDVDYIEVGDHVKTVSVADLNAVNTKNPGKPAQGCVDKDGDLAAIVVKKESNEAISSNLLYVRDYNGSYSVDADGTKIYGYEVAMMSVDGLDPKKDIYGDKNLDIGQFASYSASTRDGYEPFYKLRLHTAIQKTTSVVKATVWQVVNADRNLIKLTDYKSAADGTTSVIPNIRGTWSADLGAGDENDIVDLTKAEWLDLRGNGRIGSVKDLQDAYSVIKKSGATDSNYPVIKIVFNDDRTSNGFRMVSMIVIEDAVPTATNPGTSGVDMTDVGAYTITIDDESFATALWDQSGPTDNSGADAYTIDLVGDMGGTLKVVPSDSRVTVQPLEGYDISAETTGHQFNFVLTAPDGTTKKTVEITVNASGSDLLRKEYKLLILGELTGSETINVAVYEYDLHNTNTETGKWLTADELTTLGLKETDFTLEVKGQSNTDLNNTFTPGGSGRYDYTFKIAPWDASGSTSISEDPTDPTSLTAGVFKLVFTNPKATPTKNAITQVDYYPAAIENTADNDGDPSETSGNCILYIANSEFCAMIRDTDYQIKAS